MKRGASLIWDVDGTLLSNSVLPMKGYFIEAIRRTWGVQVEEESLELHGRTDLQIVSQALGMDPEAVCYRMPVLEYWIDQSPGVDAESFAIERSVLKGVRDCLQRPSGAVSHQTIATGAGVTRSMAKLKAHDLQQFFCLRCASFGDLVEDRVALLTRALTQAATHSNGPHIVIGDTEEDIRAAKALQLPVIAIASGAFSTETLLHSDPDLFLEWADPTAISDFAESLL